MRWISAFLSLLIGCNGEPECDSAGLTAALEGASSGGVVRVGSCRIEGDFVLPAGAALEGEAGSIIVGRITLAGGARLANLRMESSSAAISKRGGGGAVVIEDVQIASTTGIGIGIDGASSAELSRIELRGPVAPYNIGSLRGSVPDPMTTATHGLIVENVSDVRLADISSRGFARFGVLIKDSTTTWVGGDANDNAWVGIEIEHGSASITDVEANDTLDLRLPHAAAFGVVTGTAALTSSNLSVSGSEGFGFFHYNGSVVHDALTANDNSYGGVRLEITTAADIEGSFSDNDFGAIIAYSAQNVRIRDSMITSSVKVIREESNGTMKEAGDGIQLVNSTIGARIENTMILGNDRAGIVIDLFGQNLAGGLFDNVSVSRDGATENGVLVQGGTQAADWALGLTRDAETVAADEAITDAVDIVGAVGPCFFPAP